MFEVDSPKRKIGKNRDEEEMIVNKEKNQKHENEKNGKNEKKGIEDKDMEYLVEIVKQNDILKSGKKLKEAEGNKENAEQSVRKNSIAPSDEISSDNLEEPFSDGKSRQHSEHDKGKPLPKNPSKKNTPRKNSVENKGELKTNIISFVHCFIEKSTEVVERLKLDLTKKDTEIQRLLEEKEKIEKEKIEKIEKEKIEKEKFREMEKLQENTVCDMEKLQEKIQKLEDQLKTEKFNKERLVEMEKLQEKKFKNWRNNSKRKNWTII